MKQKCDNDTTQTILKTVKKYKNFIKTKYNNMLIIKLEDKYITDIFNISARADAFMNIATLEKNLSGEDLLNYGRLFSKYKVCLMTITNHLFGGDNNNYDYEELTKYWNIAKNLNLLKIFNLDYLISEDFSNDFSNYLKSLNIELVELYYDNDYNSYNYPQISEDYIVIRRIHDRTAN